MIHIRLKSLCCNAIGLCLLLSITFCGYREALAIPLDFTTIAEKNFSGIVTDFIYSGFVTNTDKVPVGSLVNGIYTVGGNNDYFIFESSFSIQGNNSEQYASFIPSGQWGIMSLSLDSNDLHYAWKNGFPTDLFGLFFKGSSGADGGSALFDINNFSSDLFSGTGILHYETNSGGFPDNVGISTFDLAFTVTPVPEPSALLLLGIGLCGFAVWRMKHPV